MAMHKRVISRKQQKRNISSNTRNNNSRNHRALTRKYSAWDNSSVALSDLPLFRG
jgi:hypothetical protein